MSEGLKTQASWIPEFVKLFASTSKGLEVLQTMESISTNISFNITTREELQAVIEAIRDGHLLVLVIKGDAPWILKLAC